MRQHVNPLSNYYDHIIPIPLLSEIFKNPYLPLHLDLGSGTGDFLFRLALENQDWNYIGIEIREKLVHKAKSKAEYKNLENLFFAYGNANNLIKDLLNRSDKIKFSSVSVNFPDPWFKKKHHKRRIIQDQFIVNISKLMPPGAFIFVKSDVFNLFQEIGITIKDSLYFKEIDYPINLNDIFNPSSLKTEREIYSLSNNLSVFAATYIRNKS